MTEVVINVFLEAVERVYDVSVSMGLLVVSIDDDMAGRYLIECWRRTWTTANDSGRDANTVYVPTRIATPYE